ncbi:MAG: hypothetical protein FuLiV2_gp2 [Hangzhou lispivirus 1]|uniref:Uncharacterized protein n=1 Tax=Hangzhou lispivirus 1 TaxID=2905568 RepID=A0A8K1XGD5_9MONO|nr:MAG: hypothetical protein FuLiV2_gp2 [Hangzhou lispivirus 1]
MTTSNPSICDLLELYAESRLERRPNTNQGIEPFSSEDLKHLPVDIRALVREIYSNNLEEHHLTPDQCEKYSNFIYRNPAITRKLSILADFPKFQTRSITVESISELELAHTAFARNWHGDPSSSLNYIQKETKERTDYLTYQFKTKFDKPIVEELPSFLKKKESATIGGSSSNTKIKMGDPNPEQKTQSLPEDPNENEDLLTLGNQVTDSEKGEDSGESESEKSEDLEEEEKAQLDEEIDLSGLDDSIPVLGHTECDDMNLDLSLLLDKTEEKPQAENWRDQLKFQKMLEQDLNLNLDFDDDGGAASMLAQSEKAAKKAKQKPSSSRFLDSVKTGLQEKMRSFVGQKEESAKEEEMQKRKRMFKCLVDMFRESRMEEFMTENSREVMFEGSQCYPQELLAAYIGENMIRVMDIEARLDTIEKAFTGVNESLEAQSQQLGQIIKKLDTDATPKSIKEQLKKATERLGKIESILDKIPSIKKPQSLLCFPAERDQTSFYEPTVKTGPCVSRSPPPVEQPPRTTNVGYKKMTPLERARLALDQERCKPIQKESPKVTPKNIPDLSPPPECPPTGTVPKIPGHLARSQVRVSSPVGTEGKSDGKYTVSVRAALKAGTPIQKYIDNPGETQKINISLLRKLYKELNKVKGKQYAFSTILDKIDPFMHQWMQRNEIASLIYNDIYLMDSLENTLVFLYAIEDLVTGK